MAQQSAKWPLKPSSPAFQPDMNERSTSAARNDSKTSLATDIKDLLHAKDSLAKKENITLKRVINQLQEEYHQKLKSKDNEIARLKAVVTDLMERRAKSTPRHQTHFDEQGSVHEQKSVDGSEENSDSGEWMASSGGEAAGYRELWPEDSESGTESSSSESNGSPDLMQASDDYFRTAEPRVKQEEVEIKALRPNHQLSDSNVKQLDDFFGEPTEGSTAESHDRTASTESSVTMTEECPPAGRSSADVARKVMAGDQVGGKRKLDMLEEDENILDKGDTPKDHPKFPNSSDTTRDRSPSKRSPSWADPSKPLAFVSEASPSASQTKRRYMLTSASAPQYQPQEQLSAAPMSGLEALQHTIEPSEESVFERLTKDYLQPFGIQIHPGICSREYRIRTSGDLAKVDVAAQQSLLFEFDRGPHLHLSRYAEEDDRWTLRRPGSYACWHCYRQRRPCLVQLYEDGWGLLPLPPQARPAETSYEDAGYYITQPHVNIRVDEYKVWPELAIPLSD